MERRKKDKKVVVEVIKNLVLAMFIINVIGLFGISSYSKQQMLIAEEKYLTEVVSNISSTISTTMHEYYTTIEILAMNENIRAVLEESTKTKPMESHALVDTVKSELTSVQQKFGTDVQYICLISVGQDSFMTHDGISSDPSATMTTKPYYDAITQRVTMVTEPYIDVVTGTIVVTVATPVYGNSGAVVGAVILDLTTTFVGDLVSNFGETGTTFVLDANNIVIGHPTTSFVGEDYGVLGLSGSNLTSQLSNPTGQIIEYQRGSDTRVGSVGPISSLGWKMIAGIDKTEYESSATNLSLALVGIQILIVFVAIIACAAAIYKRLRPLNELNEAMFQMSQGNLSHEITFHSDDEIGELCSNLRLTMGNLSLYIEEIDANLSAFGAGDFTRKSDLEFLGAFRKIQTSTEHFVNLITSTLDSIKQTVDQVSAGSNHVASGSQNLAEGTAKQSSSIDDLNQFILEITNQIHDNAESVHSANTTAHNISQELNRSNEKMDEMMVAMTKINERSEAITKIIKTIEDIAFQTNILALNAAVEAARAGSAGKGFAVVADEVRTLSGRTDEAVKNTTSLIEDSRQSVAEGNAIAVSTIENLKRVTDEITVFMQALESITEASTEQEVAIEKIQIGVEDITSVIHSTSAISEESAATSEELSAQATVMQDSILQFKLH